MEWNEEACRTLVKNAEAEALPGIKSWDVHQADVSLVKFSDFGAVDLVAGGAPCQPFSLGGKARGEVDERNMFPHFVRSIRELLPRAFILENVKGLMRPSFASYFEYIRLQLTYPTIEQKKGEVWGDHLRRLEDIETKGRHQGVKYNVVRELLNAADYGVPQTRERVFIVGFRNDTNIDWHFPHATHSHEALRWEQNVTNAYWKRHHMRPIHATGQLGLPTEQPKTKPWVTVRDALVGLPEPRADRESTQFYNHRLNEGARTYPGHTGSPMDLPAKTLKAGVHGVPGGENMLTRPDGTVRYFSVREAARIQTFPDAWQFEGPWSEAMRQLGNAVPVDLAKVVAASVAAKLRAGHGKN